MGTYVFRRLMLMIPTLVGITFLIFMLVALSPGGIGAGVRAQGGSMESSGSKALQQALLEDRYGLDASAPVQYVRWLGRISPVKFGRAHQITPEGEAVGPPRELKPPPFWDWFAPTLPAPAAAPAVVWTEGATEADRTRAYRLAAQASADARAASVGANALLAQELAAYARANGLAAAVNYKNEIRPAPLRAAGPNRTAAEWPAVEKAAASAFASYEGAQAARAALFAVFDAKPFPEAGFALIPGVLSLAAPDLGVSWTKSQPVIALIRTTLPVTLLLNLLAFPIIYTVAVPMGMLAAVRQGSWQDSALGGIAVALWSVPTVWAGVLAIGYLANNQYLGWFPVSGLHDNAAGRFRFLPSMGEGLFSRGYVLDILWHVCLPVACLVYGGFAVLSKQTRAAMLDNFNADYVRTAKAKGVSSRDIVFRHVFRNSLLPLITMFATVFPATLAGSVVVERIFSVPGMGSLIIDAINNRDRELLLANTLMIATVNLLALLLADILYAMADPRISYR